MPGKHMKGDPPLSVRLGEDLEFWVRTYAVEHEVSIGYVLKTAVIMFKERAERTD